MKVAITKRTGFILLAAWLIITGVMQALSVGNPTITVLLGILAIVAGVFILLEK